MSILFGKNTYSVMANIEQTAKPYMGVEMVNEKDYPKRYFKSEERFAPKANEDYTSFRMFVKAKTMEDAAEKAEQAFSGIIPQDYPHSFNAAMARTCILVEALDLWRQAYAQRKKKEKETNS